jgi:hypothetical protein
VVRPAQVAELEAVTEQAQAQAPVREQEQEQEQEQAPAQAQAAERELAQARELLAVAKSSHPPRSLDSRYHHIR